MLKCPHCEMSISEVTMTPIDGKLSDRQSYRCVAYSCPHLTCQKVLSIEIDPLALKADIVAEIKRRT